MSLVVMKFGGTSVADANAVRRVIQIVAAAAERHPVVVVVSAMSGVTDALLTACEAAGRADWASADDIISTVRQRHLTAVHALLGQSAGQALAAAIDAELQAVTAILQSIVVLRELTPRAKDRVIAAGELMSSRLVAAALDHEGRSSEWIDSRFVVITDDQHGGAAPLMDRTTDAAREVVLPPLECGRTVVLGGFIGATTAAVTTTLGRGGSDYSAAILGAAVGAREIQIWTDVDGMLSADPRLVSGAQLVPELSFGEASELAYFGAKVLHPSTILPAVDRGIPVRILNSMRPQGQGSLITATARPTARPLTAIACKRNVTVVDVTSTRMLMAHGFLRRLFEVFERHRTSVDVVTTSEISVSITIDDDRRLPQIEADLQAFASVQVERGLAIVSAVGDQLRADPALGVRVVAALDGLTLRMVSQAASRRNVTVVLRDGDAADAMARLHAAFFEMAAVA